jgi:hypothetical protein
MLDPVRPKRKRSPLVRALLIVLRRSHLYFGLLLAPWALLYGITGYLFNHPTHFPDNPLKSFGREVTEGTALESPQDPKILAKQLLNELNLRFERQKPLQLDEQKPCRYEGEFYMASAELPDQTWNILLYQNGSGGSVRTVTKKGAGSEKPLAWFAIDPLSATAADRRDFTITGPAENRTSPLRWINSLDQVANRSLPVIVDRLGLKVDATSFKVTTAPELVFHVSEEDRDWTVRFNSVIGSVSAQPTSTLPTAVVSWRRFLTRLHVAHGYPSEKNARWFWAILVDVMSFVMVFWGLSGIVMWWQIKRTRPWGTVALAISLAIAALLGSGMLPLIK